MLPPWLTVVLCTASPGGSISFVNGCLSVDNTEEILLPEVSFRPMFLALKTGSSLLLLAGIVPQTAQYWDVDDGHQTHEYPGGVPHSVLLRHGTQDVGDPGDVHVALRPGAQQHGGGGANQDGVDEDGEGLDQSQLGEMRNPGGAGGFDVLFRSSRPGERGVPASG